MFDVSLEAADARPETSELALRPPRESGMAVLDIEPLNRS
jgi:hypothetical protein